MSAFKKVGQSGKMRREEKDRSKQEWIGRRNRVRGLVHRVLLKMKVEFRILKPYNSTFASTVQYFIFRKLLQKSQINAHLLEYCASSIHWPRWNWKLLACRPGVAHFLPPVPLKKNRDSQGFESTVLCTLPFSHLQFYWHYGQYAQPEQDMCCLSSIRAYFRPHPY